MPEEKFPSCFCSGEVLRPQSFAENDCESCVHVKKCLAVGMHLQNVHRAMDTVKGELRELINKCLKSKE